jgi:uncharacterized protein (TIGR02300 family)
MPDLGTKFECFSCGAKFYDLGKGQAICPKCGADQKNAVPATPAQDAASARRRRKEELAARRVETEAERPAEEEAEPEEKEVELEEGEVEEATAKEDSDDHEEE